MKYFKMKAVLFRQDNIATDVYSMIVDAPEIAQRARPGQFVNCYSADGSRLLPRPISICDIDRFNGFVRLVYRKVGKGTAEFSNLRAGDKISIIGPLGNGYTLRDKKRAILVGGGIGIPPLLALARELTCEKTIVLGFRDEEFLSEEFYRCGTVYKSSDAGNIGIHGTVMDAIEEYKISGDVIYACGPRPMLSAIQAYALAHNIEAQLSLEERMACGVGACLGCVCQTSSVDEHSQVKNKRVCKEGPVFDAREVVF